MLKGLYVHVPFCFRKCYYCDFVSGISPKSDYVQEYFEALNNELKIYSYLYDFSTIKTLYFGGGTPSLFPKEIAKISEFISRFSSIEEITVEANPYYNFSPYDFEFATRISFGVQTFSEKYLKILGRDHSSKDSVRSIQKARDFFSVNADLIFGVPKQSPAEYLEDIKKLLSLGVDHISCYLLEIHEGTLLWKMMSSGLSLDLPENIEDFFDVQEYIEEAGFVRYEVSNFAKPSSECKHNLLYWNREDFLGVGVSAWSKIENVRFCNTKNIREYINNLREGKLPIEVFDKIEGFRVVEEIIFLGLRKIQDGISLGELYKEGLDVSGFLDTLKSMYSDFLSFDENRIRINKQHIPVIDEITARLIVVAERFYKFKDRLNKIELSRNY